MPNRDLVETTLRTIEREFQNGKAGFQYDQAFDLVDNLIADFGEDDLLNRLHDNILDAFKWEIIAQLYGILAWSCSNESRFHEQLENWLLLPTDERKVYIALNNGFIPFSRNNQTEKVLSQVARKFPNQATCCFEIIEEHWKNLERGPNQHFLLLHKIGRAFKRCGRHRI